MREEDQTDEVGMRIGFLAGCMNRFRSSVLFLRLACWKWSIAGLLRFRPASRRSMLVGTFVIMFIFMFMFVFQSLLLLPRAPPSPPPPSPSSRSCGSAPSTTAQIWEREGVVHEAVECSCAQGGKEIGRESY